MSDSSQTNLQIIPNVSRVSTTRLSVDLQIDLFAKFLDLCQSRGVQIKFTYTPKEAARMLSVSTKTLERMRLDGTGPRITPLRGRGQYKLSELWEWLERQPLLNNSGELKEELSARRTGVA